MIHSIRGGLRLEANKQRSTRSLLRSASIPDELVIPLDQHAGDAAIPLVTPGDAVLLGQPIAQPGSELSAWLHSPVSGTIAAIESRPTTQHVAPCIVIRNDGRDTPYGTAPVDFQSLSPAALCEHIARGGIVGLGGATFPTNVKLGQASGRQNLHLLLNGAECEPWISCDDALMREHAADIIFGAGVLRHALGAAKCTIAVEDDVPEAVAALRTAAAGSDIAVAVVWSIYPAGGERQLIYAVTGNEVPSGGLPSDIAVICQNVGTAAAAARWLRDGQPLISRIVTVTGSGVREPGNLEMRIGTPVATLIADCGGYADTATQLIMGGSMMGLALTNDTLPAVKGTNCVIVAAGTDLHARDAE
ncbi:MAG TPA: electron transport complex subunit RsxC, partial [Povalibacter sp.]